MALQRPLKEGNVRTYQEKVTLNFLDILASEADADHDTIYAAWNGALGGDLTGTLPNPTVVAAAKSKWTDTGATLTPTNATKHVAVPSTDADALTVGISPFARVSNNAGSVGISCNWLTGSTRDDPAKVAWRILLGPQSDFFRIDRQNTSGTQTFPFMIDSAGKITVPGSTDTTDQASFVCGTVTGKGRWTPSTGGTQYFSANCRYTGTTWVRDDGTLGAWRLSLGTGGNANINWQSTSDVLTQVLNVNSGGDLTIAGNNATKNTGTTWANPSDPRLKEDVVPYAAGLTEVCRLDAIRYRLKADPTRECYGFDASKVRDVFPECVSTTRMKIDATDEEETEDVLLLDLHPALIALFNAVKELADRVVALEAAR